MSQYSLTVSLVSCSIAIFHIHFNLLVIFFFFFNAPATTEIYTLSLHDALPIFYKLRDLLGVDELGGTMRLGEYACQLMRSEEHTSELQSRGHLVCRLLLEKKKNKSIKKGS